MPKKVDKPTINAVCYYLINICRETEASELKVVQKNVSYKGEALGDWEIIAKQIKK